MPVIYQVMIRPPGCDSRPYPVFSSLVPDEAKQQLHTLQRYDYQKGMYYLRTIYPVQSMRTENFDKFILLVARTRFKQNDYWKKGRKTEDLKASFELEKQLDDTIRNAQKIYASNPKYSPNNDAKQFFDIVARWRIKMKSYFSYKKEKEVDVRVLAEIKNECKILEQAIDTVVSQYAAATPSLQALQPLVLL